MKRLLRIFTAFLFVAISAATASAQNVYFREGFNEGEGELPSSAGAAVPGQYFYQNNSGTWYSFGGYRSNGPTGSCTTQTGGFSHLRFANLANAGLTSADSAFVVTPVGNHGINTVSWYNGRSSRRINVYKTTDTLATTTNWVFVETFNNTNTACEFQTVVVNDPNAKRIKLLARGGTDTDIDSVTMTSTSVITPVQFTSVNAAYTNNMVKLTWNIASEVNTAAYAIERSADGKEFKAVGTVEANNAGAYNWIDNTPVKQVVYYRIKAIDNDGKFMYSAVVMVNAITRNADVTVTPNPVRDGLVRLQLSNLEKGVYSVAVYNNNGQVIYTGSIVNDGGFSSRSIQLPAGIAKGIYRLQVKGGATGIVKNIVVE